MQGIVTAVSLSSTHSFSKPPTESPKVVAETSNSAVPELESNATKPNRLASINPSSHDMINRNGKRSHR